MPETSPIRDVADTAYWIAHWRGHEGRRLGALFHDPLATRLAGERGRRIAEQMPASRITAWQVVVRTCIIDGYVNAAVQSGVETVLNLGAGLDTRPYRLALPPTLRWIEVDQPQVIADKTAKLQGETPRCQLERIGLDLADDGARRALLERVDASSGRVLVLTEGVVPYLSNDAVATLARDLRARPHFEGWVVDYFSSATIAYRRRAGMSSRMANAPFRFEPPDWRSFFADAGWEVREMRYLPEEGQRLGRPFPAPLPMRVMMKVASLFGEPEGVRAFRTSMGFALLAPRR